MRSIALISILSLTLTIVMSAGTLDSDLIKAARSGKSEKVKELLARGADPNARDGKGVRVLEHSWKGEYLNIVRLLLDSGAVSTDATGSLADFVLVWALETNHADTVAQMKARSATAKTFGGAALTRVIRTRNVAALRGLLVSGADPSSSEALIEAAESGDLEMVRLLLEYKAPIGRQRDAMRLADYQVKGQVSTSVFMLASDGFDALMAAVEKDNLDIVRLLLGAGADPNRPIVALPAQIPLNINPAFLYALKQVTVIGDAKAKPAKEVVMTAMAMAAQNGFKDIVETLLENGADTSVPGVIPPIVWAASEGHASVVRALLVAGASDTERAAALRAAKSENHSDIVALLDTNTVGTSVVREEASSVPSSGSAAPLSSIEGMDRDGVIKILGQPSLTQREMDGVETLYFDTWNGTIKVYLFNGRASGRRQR